MKKKKVLFLIHDLLGGGAEKVLVNLVNNMDFSRFDITVLSLFDEGVNKQFLNEKVHYLSVYKKMFRGNQHYFKLFSPAQLHKRFIKNFYDIEIAYLEGPCARIISGCQNKETKLVSWIHIEQQSTKVAASSFRSVQEANVCYNKFHSIICVSESVKQDFQSILSIKVPVKVLYNTNESQKIIQLSKEELTDILFPESYCNIIAIGKLLRSKGFDVLLRIVNKLVSEGYRLHLFILGAGELENELKKYIANNNLKKHVDMLGYCENPYKYLAHSDLFVCASLREGFSTAATEALILGIPVCTVNVSGMKELLGMNNEYGLVTDNNEESLLNGIKQLLDDPDLLLHYKKQAEARGKVFNTENTVKAVENMLIGL